MISALEIAAIFKIDDQATGSLTRISDKLKVISDQLKAIVDQAQGAVDKLGGIFTKMDTSISGQITATDKLAEAWARVTTAANDAATAAERAGGATAVAGGAGAAGAAGAAAAGGAKTPFAAMNRKGGGGGIHGPTFYSGTPFGGGSAHMRGGAGVAAAGIGVYSIYEAYEVHDYVYKALANAFPGQDPKSLNAQAADLTQIINENAVKIGASPIETAKMAMDEIKTNPTLSWQDRLQIMPRIIQWGAWEAYNKGMKNPAEAVKSFVGQMHQGSAFTLDEIENYAPTVAFFNAKDPNSVVNIAKSEAYHVPIDTSLAHIPIAQELAAQTVLDQLSVGGKAGTWIRQMALRGAMPSKLLPEKKYNAAIADLEFLGLESGGHSTWMTDGHYDQQKLLHILAEREKGLDQETAANDLLKVFGSRGGGALAALIQPNNLARYDALLAEEKSKHNISSDEYWAQQNAGNPMQAMRVQLSQAQVLLYQLGTQSIPFLTGALSALKTVVDSINPHVGGGDQLSEKDKRIREAEGKGATYGAGAGALIGLLTPVPFGTAAGAVLGAGAGGFAGRTVQTIKEGGPTGLGLLPGTLTPDTSKPAPHWYDQFVPSFLHSSDPTKPEKQSYNVIPSKENPKPITLAATLNIDGTLMAQTIASKLAEIYENSPNAPTSNDASTYDSNGGIMAG